MPTLKEIKGRISSVQNTLKITSAMKLVSSAKLRKAQTAIEDMIPYQAQLNRILSTAVYALSSGQAAQEIRQETPSEEPVQDLDERPVVILAFASNTSLCGGFNANAVAKVRQLLKEYPDATVYSIGRKMADAMRKVGYPSPVDYTSLSEHPAYAPCSELAGKLLEDHDAGKLGRVFLVYNHFVSTAKQVPTVEQFLPAADTTVSSADVAVDAILEPSARELLDRLAPKALKLRLFTTLLDNAAAEHAARTVAMQAATDNAEDLLQELTLQYNKGRQQKITSEILDLAGGQQ